MAPSLRAYLSPPSSRTISLARDCGLTHPGVLDSPPWNPGSLARPRRPHKADMVREEIGELCPLRIRASRMIAGSQDTRVGRIDSSDARFGRTLSSATHVGTVPLQLLSSVSKVEKSLQY